MTTNVYQTPQAELLIEQDIDDQQFYIVSPKKFWVLFMSTLGLYAVYWFYKNFSQLKKANQDKTWPVARAIFSIFFTHSLFRNINNTLEEKNIEPAWKQHGALATLYVVITLVDRLADRALSSAIGENAATLVSFLTLPIIGWILYQAQLRINLACESDNGEENSNFTAANIVWIVLGSLLWLLFLAGMVVLMNPELLPAA